ncbi:MAG: hypothetical protein PVI86_08400 [Phycisphaerae bacterium]
MMTPTKHRPMLTGRTVLAVLMTHLVSAGPTFAQNLPQAVFHNEPALRTNEGHVSLSWSADLDSPVYELQGSPEAGFAESTCLYRGADETSFRSGLADGRYYYRVRARQSEAGTWGPWSKPVELVCEHHSMAHAWTLFALGSLLFLLIALFVGINARHLDRFEGNNG